MKRLIILFAAFASITVAAGCGQSGPLYLPGDPSQVRQPPAPAEQDAEGDEEEADARR